MLGTWLSNDYGSFQQINVCVYADCPFCRDYQFAALDLEGLEIVIQVLLAGIPEGSQSNQWN